MALKRQLVNGISHKLPLFTQPKKGEGSEPVRKRSDISPQLRQHRYKLTTWPLA